MEELKLVTVTEAANRLGVHPKTISRLVRQGRLAGVKLANRWLISEATFRRFSETYVGKKGRPKGWSPKREVQQ